MYIEPGSECYLLSGVPLDATYQHTIYFESKEAQEAYFKQKINVNNAPEEQKPYAFNKQTYIRVLEGQRGMFKAEMLPHNSDDMMTLNYIMFRNDLFQHKWFYAFITDIIFVGNRVYNIHFELDYMQTYMFNYKLKECWIERQHVSNDEIGRHTLPEPVDLGPYKTKIQTYTNKMDEYSVMIGYVQGEGSGSVSATYISGQFSGVFYEIKPCNSQTEATEIGSFLAGFTEDGKNDNIVCISYVPSYFVSSSGATVTYTAHAPARPTDLNGYTPRNKKLLTFPYTCIHVTNGDGDETVLHYELFSDPENPPAFWITGATSPTPQILCVPKDYNGEIRCFDEKIAISEFPQCAYAIDTYRAWLAMNSGQQQINAVRSIGSSIASGSPVPALMGAWQQMNDASKAAIMSDKAKGTQTGSAMVSARWLDFYFAQKSILPEYARVIDDYFDRFGYNYQRNAIPSTHSRPHWNYVKTKGCTIVGTLPRAVAEKICSIYDNGITFWKNASEVGDYSLDNTI